MISSSRTDHEPTSDLRISVRNGSQRKSAEAQGGTCHVSGLTMSASIPASACRQTSDPAPLASGSPRSYDRAVSPPAPTAVDLFAGCGGLSLGLQWAGWELLCAVERSPMAAETYFANFIGDAHGPDAQYTKYLAKGLPDQVRAGLVVGDVESFGDCVSTIRGLLGGEELALLAGGPPCQGFSLAGRRSANDPRNDLVWRFLEAVESLSPLLVLMENVGAIQSPFERGRQANVLADLEEALQRTGTRRGGYAVVRLSLSADQYGVPQRRKRVFLIGVRKDLATSLGMKDHDSWDSNRDTNVSVPKVAPVTRTAEGPTASDALWDLMGEEYAPIESAPSASARAYACRARSGLSSQFGSRRGVREVPPPNHQFRSHRPSTRTRFQLLRIFREHGIRDDLFALAAVGRSGIQTQLKPLEPLLPLEFPTRSVRTLPQLANLVRSLGSRKHSQRALDAGVPSPTVTTLPDDFCHYAANRTLTVREMARLQSFPDTFVFKGKETTGGKKRRVEVPQYSQVGNAVPPLLAEALGLRLRGLLAPWVPAS